MFFVTGEAAAEVAHTSIGAAMSDNIVTFLVFLHARIEAHREDCRKSFGLQGNQVALIRSLQPRRGYLLVQGTETRILHATFPPEVLAFVRSEAVVLNLFNRIREEHARTHGPEDRGWKEKYLNAVMGG